MCLRRFEVLIKSFNVDEIRPQTVCDRAASEQASQLQQINWLYAVSNWINIVHRQIDYNQKWRIRNKKQKAEITSGSLIVLLMYTNSSHQEQVDEYNWLYHHHIVCSSRFKNHLKVHCRRTLPAKIRTITFLPLENSITAPLPSSSTKHRATAIYKQQQRQNSIEKERQGTNK